MIGVLRCGQEYFTSITSTTNCGREKTRLTPGKTHNLFIAHTPREKARKNSKRVFFAQVPVIDYEVKLFALTNEACRELLDSRKLFDGRDRIDFTGKIEFVAKIKSREYNDNYGIVVI